MKPDHTPNTTDDERRLVEQGKIYRIGFWVLAAGILLDVLIKAALYLPGGRGKWGIFPLVGMEGAVLAAALVLCALLAAGRGILMAGGGDGDRFPVRHYALVSLGLGLGLSVVGLGLRIWFYPYWEGDVLSMLLFLGLVLLLMTLAVFLVCFVTLYLMFRIARYRRRRTGGGEGRR